MPPKLEDAHEVLLDILKWMDAHDDVLPKRHTKPTPTQKEETALRLKYDHYIARSTALAKEQRALQQEINQRKTDRKDLDTITDVAEWSERHNGILPVLSLIMRSRSPWRKGYGTSRVNTRKAQCCTGVWRSCKRKRTRHLPN